MGLNNARSSCQGHTCLGEQLPGACIWVGGLANISRVDVSARSDETTERSAPRAAATWWLRVRIDRSRSPCLPSICAICEVRANWWGRVARRWCKVVLGQSVAGPRWCGAQGGASKVVQRGAVLGQSGATKGVSSRGRGGVRCRWNGAQPAV